MLAKYQISYILNPDHRDRLDTYRTDDPIIAEDFLSALLLSGAKIQWIMHDGSNLSHVQTDRLVAVAANRIIAKMIGKSLGIDAVEVKHRFAVAS